MSLDGDGLFCFVNDSRDNTLYARRVALWQAGVAFWQARDILQKARVYLMDSIEFRKTAKDLPGSPFRTFYRILLLL